MTKLKWNYTVSCDIADGRGDKSALTFFRLRTDGCLEIIASVVVEDPEFVREVMLRWEASQRCGRGES